MRRSSLWILPIFAVTGLIAACDSGGAPASEPTPDTVEAPEEDVAVVPDVTEETIAADTTPAEEVAVAPDYPPGPYGTGYTAIIRDLEFFDPLTGETPRLSDYYNNPDVQLLLISSAAGWCTACMYEAWDLVDVYDNYKPKGLEILYTMYEDRNADPIFQPGDSDSSITADVTFFTAWKNQLGRQIGLPQKKANYPFLADRDFVLEEYYNEGATPLTILIRTSDMRIIYRQVGYAAGTVDQLIRSYVH